MKSFFLVALLAMSTTSYSSEKPACETMALKIAKAIDRIYVPKAEQGLKHKINVAEETKVTESAETLDVSFLAPNAGRQTVYTLEFSKPGCVVNSIKVIGD